MARRRSPSRNIPLEWKTDTVVVTDTTVTRGEFDLDLLPDEIAEIYVIDSHIQVANIPDAVNILVDTYMFISMDPDVNDTPSTVVNLEDLEIFFSHWWAQQIEVGAAGAVSSVLSDHKTMQMPADFPILVGTNFAQSVVVGNTAIDTTFITTVYFKRKRATQSDLNQILLKRR